MTQAEKLEALVRRAIDGNLFNIKLQATDKLTVSYNQAASVSVKVFAESGALRFSEQISLFNKDFARALFGEDKVWRELRRETGTKTGTVRFQLANHQYHLQQAVISKDPIDYMYKEVFSE